MRPWQRQESEKTDLPKSSLRSQWLFYLIAAVGILFSFLLWYIFLLQDTANLNQLVQIHSKHVAEEIDLQLQLRIAALKHMAKHLYTPNVDPLNNWQDIKEYSEDYGGFDGLVWANSQFKLLQSKDFPDNPKLQEQFQQDVVANAGQVQQFAQQKQLWFSPSFDLPSGGKGAFVVTPIFSNNALAGYLIALIDFKRAFNFHLDASQYALQIYYKNSSILQYGLIDPSKYEVSQRIENISGINWTILVQPSQHLITAVKTILPSVALIAGIIIALLFAVATYLAQLARQRSHSLHQINIDLKKEITEREEAQHQTQKLEKGLLQGQKLQAIGTLAGGIAHDFNNLLYAIMGYVEMAQEDLKQDTVTYQNLGKVLEASRRGQELIARILSFSRRHHHELQPLNLTQCIQSVLDLLIPTIPASVTINFLNEIPKDFMAMADSTRLHQIIVNLTNNAVDAMEGEGTITLKLSVVPQGNHFLKQFAELAPGNYCRIDLTDTGHGMEQSTVERIFEPFFTTKEVGKGTGLGLATVHTIVKEHHGDIVVTSKLGSGTTFSILIPEYNPPDK
jgi:signal transduction histidine kinase